MHQHEANSQKPHVAVAHSGGDESGQIPYHSVGMLSPNSLTERVSLC